MFQVNAEDFSRGLPGWCQVSQAAWSGSTVPRRWEGGRVEIGPGRANDQAPRPDARGLRIRTVTVSE